MNQSLAVKTLSPEDRRIREWVERQRKLHPQLPIPTPPQKPERRGRLGSTVGGGMVRFIQEAVAEDFVVSYNEIISGNRSPAVTLPRQVAMYLSEKITGQSTPTLAKEFRVKNHTTILHAKNKIAWCIGKRDSVSPYFRKKEKLPEEIDVKLAGRVARLEQSIRNAWDQKQVAEHSPA